jgi:hypothetical protein
MQIGGKLTEGGYNISFTKPLDVIVELKYTTPQYNT